MLILNRKPGDDVRLMTADGAVIIIRVLQSTPGKMRLGIDAPDNVKILRGELANHGPDDDVR